MFAILGSICFGDKTSCGGVVASGSPFSSVKGRAIACVGDRISCKKNCVITTGKDTHRIHGAALALHGSLTSGGCTCFSSNNDFHGHSQGAGAGVQIPVAADPGVAIMPSTAALLNEPHWIEFTLTDTENRPVPEQRYRVVDAAGAETVGVVDEKGYAKVSPVAAGTCKITFPGLDQTAVVDACQR